jgi:hypothetical protein
VLDPIEEPFDLIPLAVEMRAEADRITRFRRGGMFAQPPQELTNLRISVAS